MDQYFRMFGGIELKKNENLNLFVNLVNGYKKAFNYVNECEHT